MENKTKSLEDYKNEVLKVYEKFYLNPLFGDGKIKKDLLEGLVKGFDSVSGRYDLSDNQLEDSKEYKFLTRKFADSDLQCRQINGLHMAGISSPIDLVKKVYEENFFERIGPKQNPQDGYFQFIARFRNIGRRSIDSIINYLRENDFDFSKEYAEKVVNMANMVGGEKND